jgi:RHS repeat-associated protein
MKMENDMKNSRMMKVIGLLILIGLLGIGVWGQVTISPTEGQTPSGIKRGLGSVNPYNGSLNFSLPLLEVGGRGDAKYTINHTIAQNFINFHSINFWQCNISEHCEVTHTYQYYLNSEVGEPTPLTGEPRVTRPKYSPGVMVGKRSGRYTWTNVTQTYTWNMFIQAAGGILQGSRTVVYGQTTPYATHTQDSLARLTFVTNSGREVEFRDVQSDGQPQTRTCSQGSYNRGRVFKSVDGSGMVFESDTDILDWGCQDANPYLMGPDWRHIFNPSGFLKMSNGLVYRINNGAVSWIKDKSGNKLTFNENSVVDSLGRQVDFIYVEGTKLIKEINYKGANNSNKQIKINRDSLANLLRNDQTLKTKYELFGHWSQGATNPTENDLWSVWLVSSIELPNGRQYKFRYNSYGELARIEYPEGSAIEYDYKGGYWGNPSDQEERGVMQNGNERQVYRRVTEERIYPNGGTGNSFESKITYSRSRFEPISNVNDPITVEIRDNQNNLLKKTKHYYYGNPQTSFFRVYLNPSYSSSFYEGAEYQSEVFGSDGVTLLSRSLSEITNKAIPWWTESSSEAPSNDTRPTKRISIGFEGGKALATLEETEYDENGNTDPTYFAHLNVKKVKGYKPKVLDFNTAKTGNFATIAQLFNTSDLLTISEMDYLYDENYKSRGILGLPTESRLLDPHNPNSPDNILAKSQAVYDETGQYYSMDSGYTTVGYEAPTGTYAHLRGHATTKKTWDKDNNSWIVTHTQFDNFGNVRKVWDTTGDQSRFVETVYDPAYKYAYPTKVKAPAPDPSGTHGMQEGSEINRVYDFNTGLLISVTDANGQVATTEYDSRNRPIRINPPVGGAISETEYGDTPGNLYVKTRQQIDEINWAESTTYFDNAGRAFKSKTKDLQGDIFTEVEYDSFGRVKRTSNPYRQGEQKFWSIPRYDNAGRVVETFAPAPDGQTGASTGTVQFGISNEPDLIGTYTVATDASGRKSRAISGIYGLMRVDEATGKGGTIDQDLGPLNAPNQPTYYSYNIKGEMIKITQGKPSEQGQPIQYRHFMYDSLGRLIRVRQPEQTPNPDIATTGNPENNQWTAKYTYDVLGNVVSMTDAKNITITNYYDMASRSTRRTYSDGVTPEVNYYYDGKGLPSVPAFSRGALTKVTSSVSEDRFTSFDNHGRLLASQQITDGNTYNFGYKYNISGGLLETKYPSGRIIRNFLDNDGGLSQVISKAGNSGQNKQVASNFDYTAVGSIKKMKLGNGLWETAQVNERYQLTQVGLGTTNANNNLFKIDYEYGELNADGTTVDAGKNIGMIAKTTTTIPGTTFSQTFKYDAINRLTEAKEFNPTTPTTNNWIQTFGYDRFGNRTSFNQTVENITLPTNNITKPTIDSNNNRFTTGQGYIYDFNGNLIQDAEGRTFTFDGNDKQIEVKETNAPANAPKIGRYFYDASGARVKKVTQLETTIFVYDAGGTLAAEYSTQTAPTNPTTSYMTTDHLGSPRVITDKNGNVISRRDFMPFGEEIGVDTIQTSNRSNNPQYATADKVRQKYTGYQKDEETKLDFAEARMYQNKHGRFTAVDPLMASASPINPQTFNRYVYTGNNPINYTDPSGLDYCSSNDGKNTITYSASGDCGPDARNVTGTYDIVTRVGNIFGPIGAQVGSVVFYHKNRVELIENPTQEQRNLAEQQKGFKNVEVTISATSADEICTTESQQPSSIFTPAALTPLPSLSGNGNGSGQTESGNGNSSEQTEKERQTISPRELERKTVEVDEDKDARQIGNFVNDFVSTAGDNQNRKVQYFRDPETGRFFGNPRLANRAFNVVSKGTFVIGTGISGVQMVTGDVSVPKGSLDITMGAIGAFGGPKGWIVSGTYFVANSLPDPTYGKPGKRQISTNSCHKCQPNNSGFNKIKFK